MSFYNFQTVTHEFVGNMFSYLVVLLSFCNKIINLVPMYRIYNMKETLGHLSIKGHLMMISVVLYRPMQEKKQEKV